MPSVSSGPFTVVANAADLDRRAVEVSVALHDETEYLIQKSEELRRLSTKAEKTSFFLEVYNSLDKLIGLSSITAKDVETLKLTWISSCKEGNQAIFLEEEVINGLKKAATEAKKKAALSINDTDSKLDTHQ